MENIATLSKPFQLHELLDAVAKSLEAGLLCRNLFEPN
jgi:hypothetical protein